MPDLAEVYSKNDSPDSQLVPFVVEKQQSQIFNSEFAKSFEMKMKGMLSNVTDRPSEEEKFSQKNSQILEQQVSKTLFKKNNILIKENGYIDTDTENGNPFEIISLNE